MNWAKSILIKGKEKKGTKAVRDVVGTIGLQLSFYCFQLARRFNFDVYGYSSHQVTVVAFYPLPLFSTLLPFLSSTPETSFMMPTLKFIAHIDHFIPPPGKNELNRRWNSLNFKSSCWKKQITSQSGERHKWIIHRWGYWRHSSKLEVDDVVSNSPIPSGDV